MNVFVCRGQIFEAEGEIKFSPVYRHILVLLKKITVKDFKENKKTVDDDRNVLYNVYIKYKAWYITDRLSEKDNYKLFIGDTGDEIHTEWKINNSTLQTYGINNIIDKIKDFIELALSNPYTHTIKMLDVHVN